jgi:hypothetical protein
MEPVNDACEGTREEDGSRNNDGLATARPCKGRMLFRCIAISIAKYFYILR